MIAEAADEPRGFLLDGTPIEPDYLRNVLSFADDWTSRQVSGADQFAPLMLEYRTKRCETLALNAVAGLSEALTVKILAAIDILLSEGIAADRVVDALLIAPLRDTQRVATLAQIALAHGYAATAALYSSLADKQALLRRFVTAWLSLPEELFMRLGRPRSDVWQRLHERLLVRKLLEAASPTSFKSTWALLAFDEQTPADRTAVVAVGSRLAERIFASTTGGDADQTVDEADDQRMIARRAGRGTRVPIDARRDRAIRQIDAIIRAVSKGEDERAEKFVKELVKSQIAIGDERYAVMSLCNIAKQCADAFRADFEQFCLKRALEISPSDPWALVQWGDHLKRTGQFDDAIRVLETAAGLGELVALSAIADVYTHQGRYDRALEQYRSLPNAAADETVRTAIADVLRFQGRHAEAIAAYQTLLADDPMHARAWAGIAEVYKAQGRFFDALSLYDKLVSEIAIGRSDELVYKMARGHVLKLMGRYADAFRAIDETVTAQPFNMRSRVLRASVLALMNKASEGLLDVAGGGIPHAFGEWRRSFMYGLLLLKMHRFDRARQALTARLQKSNVSGGDELLRLAAAFSFLQIAGTNVDEAEKILATTGPGDSIHVKYLRQVLELHVATIRNDNGRMRSLWRALDTEPQPLPAVASIVTYLKRREYRAAIDLELDMLLQAA